MVNPLGKKDSVGRGGEWESYTKDGYSMSLVRIRWRCVGTIMGFYVAVKLCGSSSNIDIQSVSNESPQ